MQPVDFKTLVRAVIRLDRPLRLVWSISPVWTLVNAGLLFIQGLLPLAGLYILKLIIDTVTLALADPQPARFSARIVGWVILAGCAVLLTSVCRALAEWAEEAQSLAVADAVADRLHAQSIAADLAYYDNPAYYDTLHLAQQEAPHRPGHVIHGLVSVAQNAVTIAGIVVLLVSLDVRLAVWLMAAAIPWAILRVWRSHQAFRWDMSRTETERQAGYVHSLITDSSHAKELRLYGLGPLLRRRFQAFRAELRALQLRLARQRLASDFIGQVFPVLAVCAAGIVIVHRTLDGALSVGGMILYFQAFQSSMACLQSLLQSLAGLYEDQLFLSHFYRFLDLKPAIAAPAHPQPVPEPPSPARHSPPRFSERSGSESRDDGGPARHSSRSDGGWDIRFQDVEFAYPAASSPALDGLSLRLPMGGVTALVGPNGAGKTTLVKLLCRLYDPRRGAITINGIDLREFDPTAWRRHIGVIFQDFAQYYLPALDNIGFGDADRLSDRDAVIRAAEAADADTFIGRLPRGYDTVLGAGFADSQDVSTGEWQKVALARLFFRDPALLVLDEPTSFLDPLAEASLFARIRRLSEGRTTLLISHRFSTVRLADRICVMDRGRLVEEGPHAELMQHDGFYARSFRAQRGE